MIKSVPLGQFIPGNSLVHRLDGRAKITGLIFLYIAVFAAESWESYTAVTVITVGILLLSGISLGRYFRSVGGVVIFIFIVGFFNAFFSKGDMVLWEFGFLKLTLEGLYQAIKMVLRLVLLILLAAVLSFTTTPLGLTDSIENMLCPLKKIKVPVHDIAMMMSIALRFIPTFMEEAEKIIKAQRSRGVDFKGKGIVGMKNAVIPLVIPLFLSAFRTSDDLAYAMVSRGYRNGEGRTHYRILALSLGDVVAMAVCGLIAVVFVVYRFYF